MSSSKNKDYVVEKIVSKRTDNKGRIFYLIKWKGYSSDDNTWEPENHVTKCQDMINEFELEESKKKKSNVSSPGRSSNRTTRPSSSSPRQSIKQNERISRSSQRKSSTRQQRKRSSTTDSAFTVDDDDNNEYIEKKTKRSRQTTSDSDTTPSIDSIDTDILDTAKVDQILGARRNKKTNTVEYQIQLKKHKQPVWIKSDRLTEDYSQEVIDFLEDKYV